MTTQSTVYTVLENTQMNPMLTRYKGTDLIEAAAIFESIEHGYFSEQLGDFDDDFRVVGKVATTDSAHK